VLSSSLLVFGGFGGTVIKCALATILGPSLSYVTTFKIQLL